MTHFAKIAGELQVPQSKVEATVNLLDGGATVPFISRYRKEATGSLDEVAITSIRDRITQLREMDKRRATILNTIEEQGKLTPELKKQIEEAETMAALEDLYLPYKPKKRTKATVAREKGLEPLAEKLFQQEKFDISQEAQKYLDEEKGVNNEEEALHGARDIIAEWINENQEARSEIRQLFYEQGVFRSKVMKGKEEAGHKYKDYFDWEEPIKTAPSHRVLAMRRGEKEMVLMLDIGPPEEDAINLLERLFVTDNTEASDQVKSAVKDSYKRLLKPSIETDIRLNTKKSADGDAIKVFAENLRQLLLTPPLGQKTVLALDPGFRSGCKIVVLNPQGKLMHHEAIYPNEPQKKVTESAAILLRLCQEYQVESIAIGNGTASRETEQFVRSAGLPDNIQIVMVNESGASVYSASEPARDEFPDQDVTVRGAVSIGRRLMDPLAELVKIDPKSIGVGQYQHDVDQNLLKSGLDDTVKSCVNGVGVEVNTASKELLTYVSGLGPSLAKNIVQYRNEHGPFKNRSSLKHVPKLGDKAFEQAAGFLRIRGAENPLDSSAVHPERYETVQQMADDLGCTVNDLIKDANLRKRIDLNKYISDDLGLPTLNDILEELAKPGLDPRESFEAFSFKEDVHSMEDLQIGMKLPGIVTNITNFGAFVDIGVHQDGLVHVSHLADKFVSNPAEVVKVQQKVNVTVVEVDLARKRIGLSMKSDPFEERPKRTQSQNQKKQDNKQKPSGGKKPHQQQKQKRKQKEEEPEDFQTKLEMLKGKFGKS